MIYQCYFNDSSKQRLFQEEPYVGFGLEPEVNSEITLNCPELEDPFNRLQLTEYGSFLWLWRNNVDDSWVGSTSFRQLEKSLFKFKSKSQVDDLLRTHQVVGWGEFTMLDRARNPISLRKQADVCHPGLNDYMTKLLGKLPDAWDDKCSGFFANYWVMPLNLFKDYMEYSWPIIEYSLKNIKESEYYSLQTSYGTVNKDKCIGYVMERLFILWYLQRDIQPYNPGSNYPIFHNV